MVKKNSITSRAAAKTAVASKLQLSDRMTEFKHSKRIRKISFCQTCEKIEEWGRTAGLAYQAGNSPTQDQIHWLISLVKELSTGTGETKRLLVTVEQVSHLVHLEPKSMTERIKKWGKPVVSQSGRRKAQYDLIKILPTLKAQFAEIDEDDWNKLVIETSEI